MTDQPTPTSPATDQPPTPQPPTEQTYRFSLPPVVTVEQWELYYTGQQNYRKSCKDRGVESGPLLERFHGAVSLIQRGFVHVTPSSLTDEALKAASQAQTDIRLVGLLVMGVALPFEDAINNPLPIPS